MGKVFRDNLQIIKENQRKPCKLFEGHFGWLPNFYISRKQATVLTMKSSPHRMFSAKAEGTAGEAVLGSIRHGIAQSRRNSEIERVLRSIWSISKKNWMCSALAASDSPAASAHTEEATATRKTSRQLERSISWPATTAVQKHRPWAISQRDTQACYLSLTAI